MSAEKPFKITVSDDQIRLLQQKLSFATFPDELENVGTNYGAPLSDIRRLASRWKEGFDWRVQEAALNDELPQYTRPIDVEGFGALEIHYVHKKSEVVDAIPLLFVHGWPGSFIEVRKILPLLIQASPEHPSFHVVALGLPGYGFSQAPSKRGFKTAQYAEVGHKLMLALGYDGYVTQGGDWGNLVHYGGKHSKAWHSNYPTGLPPNLTANPLLYLKNLCTPYSEAEKVLMLRHEWFSNYGKGYYTEHATQPQTIGYSLADSPVGLLAWIYEKMILWTDNYPWEDDEVLTWVSIYYFSRAGPAASVRIYYEVQHGDADSVYAQRPSIPMGIYLFPKDLKGQPKRDWYETNANLVFSKYHSEGGNFAAHEVPNLLVEDLRTMFKKGGPAFGVVSGRTGY
ncbi:Alpha/Beta hydrolase protein [Mucidula mucida]|nr:Alpha/Beta hydrolase protein [Mucidula mucida]